MRYLSVCSGVGTDHIAWEGLGWECVGFAEIETFPSAILAHRYPEIRNYGDFTTIPADIGPVDLLVGGTPCQSFSVAGQRAGLDDPRGNLTLEFARLARRLRARWIVWENVPGVLSSDQGRDFAAILTAFRDCGYSVCYRVLDAQHFGVPQRRRRVFVVGYLGDDWRPSAEVLLEQASMRGNPPKGREKGQEVAATLGGGSGSRGWSSDLDRATFIPVEIDALRVSAAVSSKWAKGSGGPAGDEAYNLVHGYVPEQSPTLQADCGSRVRNADVPLLAGTWWNGDDTAPTLTRKHDHRMPDAGMFSDVLQPLAIKTAQTSSNGIGVAEDVAYTLDGAQGQAIAFSAKDYGGDAGPLSPTLRSGTHDASHANGGVMPAVAWTASEQANGFAWERPHYPTLTAGAPTDTSNIQHGVRIGTVVRRLTPRECERLQGLPDDWTLVPYRGKPASDAPRYKAIGNGMAMPVLRWIGQRIALVEKKRNA